MHSIINLLKGLEAISTEIEKLPLYFFFLLIIIGLSVLIMISLVIPRLSTDIIQKNIYKTRCLRILLVLYIGWIFLIAILIRESAVTSRLQLQLFHGLHGYESLSQGLAGGIANIIFFLPVGIIFSFQAKPKHRLIRCSLLGFIISFFIETIQLIFKIGVFDIDDLFFNTIGALLGGVLVWICFLAFRNKSIKFMILRFLIGITCLLLLLIIILFGIYHFSRINGKQTIQNNISSISLNMQSREEVPENLESGHIFYEGQDYWYNSDDITILCMGIETNHSTKGILNSLALYVINPIHEQVYIIDISKDVIMNLPVSDSSGHTLEDELNPISLAYDLGDSQEESYQNVINSVSKLFYGIPINGYVAFNIEDIISDSTAIGGVNVTVTEDMTAVNPQYKPGTQQTLQGQEAYEYFVWKKAKEESGDNSRIIRQTVFLTELFKQRYSQEKFHFFMELDNQLDTDLDLKKIIYTATELSKIDTGNQQLYFTLEKDPAKNTSSGEFYVDDESLYNLIVYVFYVRDYSLDVEGQ